MLIITLGDPLSISCECLLQIPDLWQKPCKDPLVFVGSWQQWVRQCQSLQKNPPSLKRIFSWHEVHSSERYFLDIGLETEDRDPLLLTKAQRGRIACAALESLRDLPAAVGKLAVLTAPIDKHICQEAGFRFPGQTEFFSDLWQAEGLMILAGPKLRVALATNHLPLSAVAARISTALIERKLRALHASMQRIFQIASPRLGVAALNPHAGDGGLFGDEDQRLIAPAVAKLQAEALDVVGPKPADTLFFQAYEGQFDAVLAMYHDQGLGPLKTVHFYDAVNVTGGLAHLRVSPDHGPASELYGRGLARPDSFLAAYERASHYLGW